MTSAPTKPARRIRPKLALTALTALTALLAVSVVGGGVFGAGQLAGAAAPDGSVATPPEDDAATESDEQSEVTEPLLVDDFDIDPEIEKAFDAFDACLNQQLGDAFKIGNADHLEDEMFENFDAVWNGGVFVEVGNLDEIGDFIEFGEGDATITVTKTGGEISVSVDGDAQTIEFGDFEEFEIDDAEWGEFDAASELCEAALPAGVLEGFVESTVFNIAD